MEKVSTIGLDVAKSVFQVHGVDAQGKVVVTKRLRRDAVLAFFANLAPQHFAEPALGSGILAADQAEVAVVAVLGHRLADDDLELLPLVVPVPEVATVDPDNNGFPRDR